MTQPDIQQEIEQTRKCLGQTAELKAEAQDQAAGLSRQAGIMAIGAALAWWRQTT